MRFTVLLIILHCFQPAALGQREVIDTCIQRIESISSAKKKAIEYNKASEAAWRRGAYNLAIDYTGRGLKFCEGEVDNSIKAKLLNNLGIAEDYMGNYGAALMNYFKALRIQEKLNDPGTEAFILSNIGTVYSNQNLSDKALVYETKALNIRKELNDLHALSASLNNMAIIYYGKNDLNKAIEYYLECIRINTELGDEKGLGAAYNNIGVCYMKVDDFEQSEKYLFMCLEIREHADDPLGLTDIFANIATLYSTQKNYEKAREYYLLAVPIAKKIGSKEALSYIYENLSNIEDSLLNPSAAYDYYRLFITYRDSVQNSEIVRAQTEYELNYKFDKEKEVTRLNQEKKEERARIILYAVCSGLFIILIFSILLFKRWKETQGQKRTIEERNKLVELKNEEILDSITYAKRIQHAILPSDAALKERLNDTFVLYKPKDIVAGDFYWLEYKDGKVLFAVADCTGHGVPGAMVSVVCNNGLNRSVLQFGLTNPGQILDKTREIVIQEFEKSDDNVTDGMDIALCALDGNQLHYAGANNPLWIVRNGEILETKADKQPISKFDNLQAFQTHTTELQKGDTIYIFTDGYVDQFGGEKGKKFMARAFRELLVSIQDKSMAEQKICLDETFETWKGNNEQVDDVCIIGVRI